MLRVQEGEKVWLNVQIRWWSIVSALKLVEHAPEGIGEGGWRDPVVRSQEAVGHTRGYPVLEQLLGFALLRSSPVAREDFVRRLLGPSTWRQVLDYQAHVAVVPRDTLYRRLPNISDIQLAFHWHSIGIPLAFNECSMEFSH
jgi:hypothetical protein